MANGLIVALLLAGGSPAADDSPPAAPVVDREALRRSCRDDAFRLCPGHVALMQRARVRSCLAANRDRLSPLCRTAFPAD